MFKKCDDKRKRKVLSDNQFWAIFEKAPEYIQNMMLVSAGTSCRASELRTLEKETVYLEKSMFIVDAKNSKNGEEKTLVITENMVNLLKKAMEESNGSRYVFTLNGQLIGRTKFYNDFKKAREDAGFKKEKEITFHDLRSTAASIAERAGVDPTTIKERGEWKSDKAFSTYRHSNFEQQQKAAEATDMISRNGGILK